MVLAQADLGDLSSPIVTVVAIATIVAALVVALRAFRHNRRR
ncbi:hypothetical protein [Saccharothrix syringae]|nr:hypothetical protein [Saccharothrix syringae]